MKKVTQTTYMMGCYALTHFKIKRGGISAKLFKAAKFSFHVHPLQMIFIFKGISSPVEVVGSYTRENCSEFHVANRSLSGLKIRMKERFLFSNGYSKYFLTTFNPEYKPSATSLQRITSP